MAYKTNRSRLLTSNQDDKSDMKNLNTFVVDIKNSGWLIKAPGLPEMGRGVSTVKNKLLFGIHILIDPFCPSLQRPSVCFSCIKFRVDVVTFFVVVFPALI